MKIAIIQRVCPDYRVGFFKKVFNRNKDNTLLFLNNDDNEIKAKNAKQIPFPFKKIPYFKFNLFKRIFYLNYTLLFELIKLKPKIIFTEGDGHFLAYVQSLFYRYFINRKARVICWTYFILPGVQEPNSFEKKLRNFMHKYFDAHFVYSTFSKEKLIEKKIKPESIFISHNVSNTDVLIEKSKNLISSQAAKEKLKISNNFTVSYIGALEPAKKPEKFIEIAKNFKDQNINFLMAGNGSQKVFLENLVKENDIKNIFFRSVNHSEVDLLYAATDMLIIPGRGGMIISEAMCFGIPVLLDCCDGVELDFIQNGKNGYILNDASPKVFSDHIIKIMNDKNLQIEMKSYSQNLINKRFNTSNMVNVLFDCINYCVSKK